MRLYKCIMFLLIVAMNAGLCYIGKLVYIDLGGGLSGGVFTAFWGIIMVVLSMGMLGFADLVVGELERGR